MTSDNQYLRWGLPGFVFLLVCFIYWVLSNYFNMSLFYGDDSIGIAVVAAIIGVSIPIGFLIYQLYFTFRWWVMSARKLIKDTTRNISYFTPYVLGSYNQIKPKLLGKKQSQWPIIESYWYKKISEDVDKNKILLQRYDHLLTLYHTLGSVVTAIVLGHIFSGLLFFVFLDSELTTSWPIGLTVITFWTISLMSLAFNRAYILYNLTVFHNYVLKE